MFVYTHAHKMNVTTEFELKFEKRFEQTSKLLNI